MLNLKKYGVFVNKTNHGVDVRVVTKNHGYFNYANWYVEAFNKQNAIYHAFSKIRDITGCKKPDGAE